MTTVIETVKLSKWYGSVLGLSDVSLKIEPGIVGLLGPNGAGKSTFLKLVTGLLKPSLGSVSVFGEKIIGNYRLFARIGFCPEQDSFYDEMTGWEFLTGLMRLHGYSAAESRRRATHALETVELTKDRDRMIRAYSRGMRQRLKFAQAIAHDPDLMIMDEPLSGLDPLTKRKLIRLIKNFKAEGKTVVVSSHILPEIEALTQTIILIHQGKVFAQGDIHVIRDLIESHPHLISIKCDDPRRLASHFLRAPDVLKIHFGSDGRSLLLETNNRDQFFGRLTAVLAEGRFAVEEITSPDDNLQAVFDYLIEK